MLRVVSPVAALAIVVGGIGLSAGQATAQPGRPGHPAQPTKTLDQVQAEVDALEQDAANAAEAWNEARTRQAGIERKIAVLRVKIAAAEAAYGSVSNAVNDMARAAYASGGIEPSLQALLADDPQNFLEQSAALDQVARSQGTSLRRTQTARLALAQLKAQLTQQEAQAQAASADARTQRQLITDKLAQAQALLSSLKLADRQRLAHIAAARRAASERAARAARQRASRESSRPSSSGGNGGGGGGNGGGGYGGGGSPSSRARIAVAYALAQVGDRYVAGADGPGSFDCSGLTMAAWRHAGVSLPHYSFAQYSASHHISRSELRPGDLLFYFGGSAHHVAMYIGGGMMVSASNPRAGVEIISAWGPWYGSRYSGAGRVV
jgi:cell wall-associated NlpC family hydrolase